MHRRLPLRSRRGGARAARPWARLAFMALRAPTTLLAAGLLACGSDSSPAASDVGTVADGLSLPVALAVDATHVYVHDSQTPSGDGAAVRVPKTGGAPEVLTQTKVASELVLDDAA